MYGLLAVERGATNAIRRTPGDGTPFGAFRRKCEWGKRMTEADNLTRWQDSGEPHVWVWQCSGAWSNDEFVSLLAALRTSPYWPLNEADVLKTLEAARNTYCDLERWHLLGDQGQTDQSPASPDDGEIWF